MNQSLNKNQLKETVFFYILFLYTFSYNPFIFEAYIWSGLRISIEILTLTYLFINLNFRDNNLLIFILILISYWIYWGLNIGNEMGGFPLKLIFLIFLWNYFLQRPSFIYFCANKIIIISCIASFMAIAAFIGYSFQLLPFSYFDITFETIGEIGNYGFMQNFWVGNLLPREIFGIPFGRTTWWMFEGQYLGAFFGICILGLKNFIAINKYRKRYIILLLIAGLTTLSISFFIFFTFYFLIIFTKLIFKEKFKLQVFLIILMGTFFLFNVNYIEYLETKTSYTFRLQSAIEYVDGLQNMSGLNLIFGLGKISINNIYSQGIDFGWALVFMQFGILLSMFLAIALFRLTRNNIFFMLYVFFINSTFNVVASPFFLLLITLVGSGGITKVATHSEPISGYTGRELT